MKIGAADMEHFLISGRIPKVLRVWAFIFGSTVIAASPSLASHPGNIGDGAAQVQVWQENLPDKVVYHYRVLDIAEGTVITSVKVGYDYFHGIPLLRTRPTLIRAPQGWVGKVIHTEETLEFEVEWRTTGPEYDIKAGQELGGFAVEVPAADDLYRTTFFTVIFGRGPYIAASTHLTPIATPPPINTPPIADAGADQTVECTSPSGAEVLLNGTASSDSDGDPLTFTWTGPFGTVDGPTPSVRLPLGSHGITLSVSDGRGGSATDSVTVAVADTTPPEVTAALVPAGEIEDDEGVFRVLRGVPGPLPCHFPPDRTPRAFRFYLSIL